MPGWSPISRRIPNASSCQARLASTSPAMAARLPAQFNAFARSRGDDCVVRSSTSRKAASPSDTIPRTVQNRPIDAAIASPMSQSPTSRLQSRAARTLSRSAATLESQRCCSLPARCSSAFSTKARKYRACSACKLDRSSGATRPVEYSRMVSSIRNRISSTPSSATMSDDDASCSSASTVLTPSLSALENTASAASSVHPPRKTESRPKTSRR